MHRSARELMSAAVQLAATLNDESVPEIISEVREYAKDMFGATWTYTAGMVPRGVFPEMWLRFENERSLVVINESFARIALHEIEGRSMDETIQRMSYPTDDAYIAVIKTLLEKGLC